MINTRDNIISQISGIREASNVDVRVTLLHKLNNSLPKGMKLTLPSMFTNAYVRGALEKIEDKVSFL